MVLQSCEGRVEVPCAADEDSEPLGMVPQLSDGFEEDGKRKLEPLFSPTSLSCRWLERTWWLLSHDLASHLERLGKLIIELDSTGEPYGKCWIFFLLVETKNGIQLDRSLPTLHNGWNWECTFAFSLQISSPGRTTRI